MYEVFLSFLFMALKKPPWQSMLPWGYLRKEVLMPACSRMNVNC